MIQKILHGADVIAVFQQVSRKGMAEMTAEYPW